LLELECFVKLSNEKHTLRKDVSEMLLISSTLFF